MNSPQVKPLAFRNRHAATLIVTLSLCCSISAVAGDLDSEKAALDLISKFAAENCTTVPLNQSDQHFDVSGSADAKVSGLVRKIGELGVEGAAKYESNESQGVLQRDLAAAIKSGNECKSQLANKLIDRFFPEKAHSSLRGPAAPSSSVGVSGQKKTAPARTSSGEPSPAGSVAPPASNGKTVASANDEKPGAAVTGQMSTRGNVSLLGDKFLYRRFYDLQGFDGKIDEQKSVIWIAVNGNVVAKHRLSDDLADIAFSAPNGDYGLTLNASIKMIGAKQDNNALEDFCVTSFSINGDEAFYPTFKIRFIKEGSYDPGLFRPNLPRTDEIQLTCALRPAVLPSAAR